KPKKILIIDDESDILEFLSYNFCKNGFHVATAINGLEGIKKEESELPHFIISDILMLKLGGIEMCIANREIPQLKLTPFIFLTVVNDDYKVLYAMLSGADQYVSKPIRFEYLLDMVNQLIEDKNGSSNSISILNLKNNGYLFY
ncbi:MAG: response regulator, partial [Bacteroidetes bacterium]|nr:response regulator [Bacteroidota bacterium]